MTLVEVKKSNNSNEEKELVAKHNSLSSEYRWIFANTEKLRKEHPNKYIAVKNEQVVFAYDDAKRLLEKIAQTGSNPDDFAIEYIHKKPTSFLL